MRENFGQDLDRDVAVQLNMAGATARTGLPLENAQFGGNVTSLSSRAAEILDMVE
jgi:hypothetical protein